MRKGDEQRDGEGGAEGERGAGERRKVDDRYIEDKARGLMERA